MSDNEVTMQPVGWGVLGLANIAVTKTIPAFATAAGATLLAVASRDANKARDFARQHGIPRAHASYQSLLDDPEIEAVYVPLPNDLHCEWSARATEAGKHVLCEKPLCLSTREVAKLLEALFASAREGGWVSL